MKHSLGFKSKYLTKLLSLSIIFLFTANCSENEKQIEIEKLVPITFSTVVEEEISIPILSTGKISSQKETKLSFKTGGVIDVIYADEGEFVKKGKVLARLNLDEINAKVSQAESALDKAKRDFSRIESLYNDEVVTLEQYQNVKTALEIAEANLKIAKFNKEYSIIKAPTNGKIFRKFVESNEIIGPGTPIFLFGNTGTAWKVKTALTDNDIHKIRIGDSAVITIDVLKGALFEAKISEIAGAINPYSSTYEVELILDTGIDKLISGMIASVKIITGIKGKYKTIPINSLVNTNNLTGEIFTINWADTTSKRVLVELDEIVDETALIKKSNSDFDNVIVDGVEYVVDGSKLKIISNSEVTK